MTLRALLVGAGHAHLHVIDRAERLRAAGVRLVVVAPSIFHYSGVASAVATGALPPTTGQIDVSALARARGVTHHVGRAVGVDLQIRRLVDDAGRRHDFDVVSFNVGSATSTRGIEIDPRVLTVKPLGQLGRLATELAVPTSGQPTRIAIVGGGSAGLELAGNIAARHITAAVTVFERDARPGGELPTGARQRVVRRLVERGVRLRCQAHVESVQLDHLVVDGRRVDHDLVVLATGLVANPVVGDLGLGDRDGIPVRSTLQHVHHDEVFAVGDCARFLDQRLPRLGVHGVRQGPVLVDGLVARATDRPLPSYHPQVRALQILDLGNGRGLATRGRWWVEGRAALLVKRLIDRRWLCRYRRPDRP